MDFGESHHFPESGEYNQLQRQGHEISGAVKSQNDVAKLGMCQSPDHLRSTTTYGGVEIRGIRVLYERPVA